MEKQQKQDYESPEVIIFDIYASSVILGSWGDGAIGEDDGNDLYVL